MKPTFIKAFHLRYQSEYNKDGIHIGGNYHVNKVPSYINLDHIINVEPQDIAEHPNTFYLIFNGSSVRYQSDELAALLASQANSDKV